MPEDSPVSVLYAHCSEVPVPALQYENQEPYLSVHAHQIIS